jgi:hypothetical protein
VACAAYLSPCLPPVVATGPGDEVQCRSTAKLHFYDVRFGTPVSWSVKHHGGISDFTIDVAQPTTHATQTLAGSSRRRNNVFTVFVRTCQSHS